MATIEVDLDDFDDDDVLERALEIVEYGLRNQASKQKLIKIIESLGFDLSEHEGSHFKIENINDEMKFEYIQEVFKKYSLEDIENALPL